MIENNQKIQTIVKSHVMIFFDKSKKEITEKQAVKITELSCISDAKGFNLDGGYYRFADITKVLTLKEYYEQYPDKRPPNPLQPVNEMLINKKENYSAIKYFEKNRKKLNSMIRGVKKHMNSNNYNGGIQTKILLKEMEEKLRILEVEAEKVPAKQDYSIKNKPSEAKMKTYGEVKDK